MSVNKIYSKSLMNCERAKLCSSGSPEVWLTALTVAGTCISWVPGIAIPAKTFVASIVVDAVVCAPAIGCRAFVDVCVQKFNRCQGTGMLSKSRRYAGYTKIT